MRILNNLKFSMIMTISTILMSILLVIFGIYFYITISRTSELSHYITEHPLQVSNASSRAYTNVEKISSLLKDIVYIESESELYEALVNLNTIETELTYDLSVIEKKILGEEGRNLYEESFLLYTSWLPTKNKIIELTQSGNNDEARTLLKESTNYEIAILELKFSEMNEYAFEKADFFITEIDSTVTRNSRGFAASVFFIIVILISTNAYIFNAIFSKLKNLTKTMDETIETNTFNDALVIGHNEISELTIHFNNFISLIREQNWLTSGLSGLQIVLSKSITQEEVISKYIEYCCEYISAIYGAIYLHNEERKELTKIGGYSTSKNLGLSETVSNYEGTLGQVAYSKNPIHIKELNENNILIKTSGYTLLPTEIYTYPILSGDGSLLCVVEIGSQKIIDSNSKTFLNYSAESCAPYIQSAGYYERTNELLQESKDQNNRLTEQSNKLQVAYKELENSQAELEQNTKELQNLNQELELNSKELELLNSELERQQQQLISKNTQLENATNLKTEFLANMSHELRTPLNSIILLSKLLTKKDNFSKDDIEKLIVINNAGDELLTLINNLLDISKIESGKMEIFKEEISSIDLSQRLELKFKALAKDKNVDFIIEDHLKNAFVSDKQKLLQILTNFLSNSFKFTKEGSVKVIFEPSDNPNYNIKITVKDTGIGIKEDKKDIIFEAFRQSDGSITREYGGTGLGLSIVSNLAAILDGKLTLESQFNEGTTFTLYLPSKLTSDIDENFFKEINKPVQIDNSPFNLFSADEIEKSEGKTILLIEDDATFIEQLKPYINQLGFNVVIAKNGYDGIKMASKIMPDGIILDLVLPDINGGRVLKEIKLNPVTRGIPIHILTVSDTSNQNNLLKHGAAGYTQKSPYVEIDAKKVMDSISKVLSKQPKNLLIVEDDNNEVESIRDALNDWKLNISVCETVKRAISLVNDNDYDAIVLDLKLKDGTGWDICKYIKDENIKIPIIIYTAKSLTEQEYIQLRKYSDSIILKNATSRGNLLEEIAIFIHKIYDWKDKKVSNNHELHDNLKNKKILICDDDARNVFALSAFFEGLGVEILESYNGQEALDVLESNHDTDLVLMDIMMPVMDGLQAMKEIRKNSKISHIPIIALTAKAMKGDRESCLAAGANDYLSKPIDMDMLTKLIKLWIGESK